MWIPSILLGGMVWYLAKAHGKPAGAVVKGNVDGQLQQQSDLLRGFGDAWSGVSPRDRAFLAFDRFLH